MSALLWVALPVVYVVAAVWSWSWLVWGRRGASSYSRLPDVLDGWRALSAREQEDVDTASLDMAEQAEIDARADAVEAAGVLAVETAARINVLSHP